MKIYKTNKAVLSVKNNPQQFLNGITSNSLDTQRNAFLNIHGKIIATFDQLKINDQEFLLVIEKEYIRPALDHLDRYAKLSRATLTQESFNVYFDLDGFYELKNDECAIGQKKGKLVLTKNILEQNVSDEEFTRFRLDHNIPMLGVDYRDELLLNVSEDEFVSFTKGCYLGQEPISKVHNRSKPTWKLVVRYFDECSPEEQSKMTSKVTDPQENRARGFIFVKN